MRTLRSAGLAAFMLVLAFPAVGSAQVTTFFDLSPFSGTETVVTFEIPDFPPNFPEPLSEHSGLLLSLGSTGVGLLFGDTRPRPFGPITSPYEFSIDNDFAGCCLPIEITFPSALTKVAFESSFNGYGAGVTVNFYAGADFVGTATSQAPSDTSTSPNGWIYTGFESAVPFDRIVITGPNNGYLRIDNVRFETVSAPPLVAACVASVNPSGQNTPSANNQDGFFRAMADGGSGALTLALGSYTLANGESFKVTLGGPGGVRLVNRMGAFGIRHFQVNPGPAQVVVTDGTTTATADCLFRP